MRNTLTHSYYKIGVKRLILRKKSISLPRFEINTTQNLFTMTRLKALAGIVLLLCALTLWSCEENDPSTQYAPNAIPEVTLDTNELNIDGGGGLIPIFYGVTNPRPNTKPEAKSNVEWITIGEVANGKITLNIAPSDVNEERYGIVTVTYSGMAKSLKVYITQDRQILNLFTFEVSNITYKSCTVKYTPKDETITYMANIIDKEYFNQSGISTEEGFIAAEMENYSKVAEQYGMSLEELMSRLTTPLIYKGEAIREFNSMQHGATYVVYSYGITFNQNDYEVTTPIHYTIVELPMPTFTPATFDITANTTSGMTSILVSPEEWSGYYTIQIIPESSIYYTPKDTNLSDHIVRAMANDFYNRARKTISQGLTPEAYLERTCYRGSYQLNTPLEDNIKYMIAVFGVKSEDGATPVICTMPSVAYID